MKFYAQLNENNICIGISQLSGKMNQANMIEIQEFTQDYIWKKYENEQWSEEKFEPITNVPVNELEKLKEQIATLQQTIIEIMEV